jgi:hypothetical protein
MIPIVIGKNYDFFLSFLAFQTFVFLDLSDAINRSLYSLSFDFRTC